MPEFTPEEKAYIEYLNELFDAPNYGLLLYKGDPTAFNVGIRDWLSNLSDTDKYSLGLESDLPVKDFKVVATKTIEVNVKGYETDDVESEFLRGDRNGIYEEEWQSQTPSVSYISQIP